MRTEEELLAEVARCREELASVVDNRPHEGAVLARIDALLWALNAPALQCARCLAPLGDEAIVATTYDDEPAGPTSDDEEVLIVHARCAGG